MVLKGYDRQRNAVCSTSGVGYDQGHIPRHLPSAIIKCDLLINWTTLIPGPRGHRLAESMYIHDNHRYNP